jgi:hypothetical protein
VSGFVMALVVALCCAALFQAPVALPDLMHAITPVAIKHRHRQHVAHKAKPSPTPSSTTPTTPSPPPSAETPPPLKTHPTFNELCGDVIAPGDGIPVTESQQLKTEAEQVDRAWHALGAAIAACPEMAKLVPKSTDVYYAYGDCEGQHRTLAVVSPEYPAQMVIDPLFTVARKLVEQGVLLGASIRTEIGPAGDFQILYTTSGPYVAIREFQTNGHGGPSKEPETCQQLKPAKVKYVVLPPGMVKLWLSLGALGEPTWPILERGSSSGQGPVSYSFLSAENPSAIVAHGQCSATNQCQLAAPAVTLHNWEIPAQSVTTATVLEQGP